LCSDGMLLQGEKFWVSKEATWYWEYLYSWGGRRID
jgi:hypothetical protein